MYAGLQELRLGRAVLSRLRRAAQLPPPPYPPPSACPCRPSPIAASPPRHHCACNHGSRIGRTHLPVAVVRFRAGADRSRRRRCPGSACLVRQSSELAPSRPSPGSPPAFVALLRSRRSRARVLRVGLQLGAVVGNAAEPHVPRRAAQPHHVAEQVGERGQVAPAEGGDGPEFRPLRVPTMLRNGTVNTRIRRSTRAGRPPTRSRCRLRTSAAA